MESKMPEQDEFSYLKDLRYNAPQSEIINYLLEQVLILIAKVRSLQTFSMKYAYVASKTDVKELAKELVDLNISNAHKTYADFLSRFGEPNTPEPL
jgi:hypothetical protein